MCIRDREVTVQEPETPAGARVLWLTDTPLTGISGLENLAEQGYDAVAVTVKDSSGSVYYDSETALPAARKAAGSTAEAWTELTGSDMYTIARLSCLLDLSLIHIGAADGGVRQLPQAHGQGEGDHLPGRPAGHHQGLPAGV